MSELSIEGLDKFNRGKFTRVIDAVRFLVDSKAPDTLICKLMGFQLGTLKLYLKQIYAYTPPNQSTKLATQFRTNQYGKQYTQLCDIVPEEVAYQQCVWLRAMAIVRMHDQLGMTFIEIAELLKISRSRPPQIYHKMMRIIKQRCPLEKYLEDKGDFPKLAGEHPKRTVRHPVLAMG